MVELLEKLIKNIKKHWIISASLLFLFFMWFPIIFYFTFMTWEFPNLYMEDNPWIGFIGGYFGAIFGGIVSGLFTFLGIRYTIKNNEKDNFLATYFERKYILEMAMSQIWAIKFLRGGSAQEKIEHLIDYIPDLKELTDTIYKEVGGSIGGIVSKLSREYKYLELYITDLEDDDESLEKLAAVNFSLLDKMHDEIKAYTEKLDDRYSKYQ